MTASGPSPNHSHAFTVHWQTCVMLAPLLAGFAWLRIASGHYGYWIDEYYTLIFAGEPLSHLWSGWMVHETNPPLFYTMVKAWQALGLRSVDQIRLLPELVGLIGLALLGTAGWIGWGHRAAIPAIVLAGLSAQNVHVSQLVRGYGVAADGVIVASIGLLMVLRRPPGSGQRGRVRAWMWGWGLYVLGSTLAIYSHTTMLLWPVVATLALPIAAGRDWRPALRDVLIANCGVALSSAWWLWITLRQLIEHVDTANWIVTLSHREFVWKLSQNMLLINEGSRADHRLSQLIAVAAVAGALITLRQPATRLMLAAALLGAGIMELAQFIHPIVTPITLYWLSIFVVLLISAGIAAIRSPWLASGALLLLAGALGANFVLRGPRVTPEDFTNGIRMAASRPHAALLVDGPGSGATAAMACRVEYPDTPCPVHIITVMSPGQPSPWYLAQAPNRVPGDKVQAALTCCASIFSLRHAAEDPLVRFGIATPESAWDGSRPYPEGPFSAEQFSPRRYRPPPIKP